MNSKTKYLKSFVKLSGFNKPKNKLSKSLHFSKKNNSGRNNLGRITVRHRGGGHKQKYRLINYKYNDKSLKIKNIEYDPNRTCFICLAINEHNTLSYKLLTEGTSVGDVLSNQDFKNGNFFKLQDIPLGSLIHSLEIKPGKGAQLARSAGTYAKLLQKNLKLNLAKVQLSSKSYYYLPLNCFATLGTISNMFHKNKNLAKAGRSRWLNKRPSVRGVAMNPVDHPHGGGEGKTSGGRPSVTPWGKITKGKPTRNKKKRIKVF
jgi:large subunit ribosomal protein L2